MQNRQNIINKIKALLSKTVDNGCTEAEALSAADKVGALMAEYDLTMSQVEYANETFVTGVVSTKSAVQGPLHNLITSIARFTDTKVWFSRTDVLRYSFFGSENDVRVAEYMCSLLLVAIENEIKNFKKTDTYKAESKFIAGKTLTTSFKGGMVNRLSKRLVEMKHDNKFNKSNETGIVLYDKTAIVESKFQELGMRLKTEKSRVTVKSSSAFASGVAAANRVSITTGKQVKNGQKALN